MEPYNEERENDETQTSVWETLVSLLKVLALILCSTAFGWKVADSYITFAAGETGSVHEDNDINDFSRLRAIYSFFKERMWRSDPLEKQKFQWLLCVGITSR